MRIREQYTVKHLRALIADLPDNTVILVPSHDHSYREANSEITTARFCDHEWTEDHGEEYTPTEEYGPAIKVVVIGQ